MTVKKEVKSDAPQFAITLARPARGDWGRFTGFILLFLLLLPRYASALYDDPMEVLAKARLSQASQFGELEGEIRRGETVVPFTVKMDGGEIAYTFAKPDQTIVLQLGDKGPRLVEVTKKGSERVVTDAQYDQAIRGSIVTYEDLSMRFLYWPVAKIIGEDIELTRNCWKLRIEPGSAKNSQYGYVVAWIEKQSGSPVRVETYDKGGAMLKRFLVTKVQKIEGGYILKEMRIQQMENGKPKDPQPTYIEIKKTGEQ